MARELGGNHAMKHPGLVVVAVCLFCLSAVLYRHFVRHVADGGHYTFITVRGAVQGTHETIGGGNIWEIGSFFFVAAAGAIFLLLAFVDFGRNKRQN
jgi:hypothetical protein